MAAPNRSRLPQRVRDRIEEAGGSAYLWYDQELAAWIDPSGFWSRLSRSTRLAGLVAVPGFWAGAAFAHHPMAAVAILAVAVFGLIRTRFTALPWWVSVVAVAAADPFHWTWQAVLVTVAGAGLLCLFGSRRHRDMALAVLATATAVGRFGVPTPTRVLVTAVVAVVLAVAALWWLSGKTFPARWGKVTADDLTVNPPPPPSTLPWLLPRLKGNAAKIDKPPREITRKRVGGFGERKTALLLLGLRRGRGTRIGHDVDLPGADSANVDHFVLTRAGVFVVDSKQYGTVDDPGRVTVQGSRFVHLSNRGSRDLSSSLATAAWATRALAEALQVPARGVLVIHNAAVEPGLVYRHADGTEVDLIPAENLVARIDGAPGTLTRSALTNASWRTQRLVSSTTGRAPRLTSPLGVRGRRRAQPWQPDLAREQEEHDLAREQHHLVFPEPETEFAPPPEPEPAPVVQQPAQQTVPADPGTEMTVPVLDPGAMDELSRVAESQDRLQAVWSQIGTSERADPSEVSEELRTLSRGTKVEVVEFANDDLRSYPMIALSPPCAGIDHSYVWVCRPADWRIHSETGRPVFAATVSTDKIIVTG